MPHSPFAYTVHALITSATEAAQRFGPATSYGFEQRATISFNLAQNGKIDVDLVPVSSNHQKLIRPNLERQFKDIGIELRDLLREHLPAIATGKTKTHFVFGPTNDGTKKAIASIGPWKDNLPDYCDAIAADIGDIADNLAGVTLPGNRLFTVEDTPISAASPEDAVQIYLAMCDKTVIRDRTYSAISKLKVKETHRIRDLIPTIDARRHSAA